VFRPLERARPRNDPGIRRLSHIRLRLKPLFAPQTHTGCGRSIHVDAATMRWLGSP
jgi:hypothetical protein